MMCPIRFQHFCLRRDNSTGEMIKCKRHFGSKIINLLIPDEIPSIFLKFTLRWLTALDLLPLSLMIFLYFHKVFSKTRSKMYRNVVLIFIIVIPLFHKGK